MTADAGKPEWLAAWQVANPAKVEAAKARYAELATKHAAQREAQLAAWVAAPKPKASTPKPSTAAPQPAQRPEAKLLLPAGEKPYSHAPELIGKEVEEPGRWPFDGGKRREQVLDHNFRPPRVVRSVGWRNCIMCKAEFFSRDVTGQRMCDRCRPIQPPW